jgi:AcrR family transcriptional regulator
VAGVAVTEAGKRTRAHLLAGAARLIREQGVERTSLDEILELTGTSKSQLYHYFTDKDALVRAVIAYQAEWVLERSAPVIDRVDSWAALRHWLDAIVAAQEADGCRHGCPVGTIAAELADYHDGAREDLAASFVRWEDAIAAALERLKARGRLRARADTRALATATLAAIQGGLLLSKTFRDPTPLRRALDSAYLALRSSATGS